MMASMATARLPASVDAAPAERRVAAPPPVSRGSSKWQDALFEKTTLLFAMLVLGLLVAIIASLVGGAMPAFKAFGPAFFVTNVWNPVTLRFGALAPIFGTLVTSAIALLIGIPVSFGIAVFLTEMCPPMLKRPLGTAVELLAAIPSIIYGMWGLFVFAPVFADHVQRLLTQVFGPLWIVGPLFQGAPNGIGMLSAGIILSVMVIPF